MRATLHTARIGLACLTVLAAGQTMAATSFSNSLKGFTGNSTVPATRTALATAGFDISTITGAGVFPDPGGTAIDPTITFDADGVHFGTLIGGDGGRNYIRTTQLDYATTSFTAEITFTTADIEQQDIYFGVGAGEAVPTQFRTPDWTTQASSVMYYGETEDTDSLDVLPTLDIFRTADNVGHDEYTDIPGLTGMPAGTHRLRITFDRYARTFTLGFDVNFTGTFTADTTTAPTNIGDLYGPTGWNNEVSKIYFGADDGMLIKDFAVTTSGLAAKDGDFTGDGNITVADWVILRNNQHKNVGAGSFQDAYFLGDLNGDKKNDFADFALFKADFDAANGVGAFVAMLGSVPEPTSAGLAISAGLLALARGRRAAAGRQR